MRNPYGAYQQVAAQASTGREAEAIALEKGAQLLMRAIENPGDKDMLDHALSINNRIWALLYDGATKEENPLPDELRAAVVSLYIFISKTSLKALAEDVSVLRGIVNVNRHLAVGLRAEPPE